MAKQKINTSGIVYSTDPSFVQHTPDEPIETITPSQQELRIRLETKHRAGKAVIAISGFAGMEKDLEELGKKLKAACGTGGTAKDGLIIIQGDNRDKIMAWLQKNGYTRSKKG